MKVVMVDPSKSKSDKIRNNKFSGFKNKRLSDQIIPYNRNNSILTTHNQNTLKKTIEFKSDPINKIKGIQNNSIINYYHLKQQIDKNLSDDTSINHNSSLLGKIMVLDTITNHDKVSDIQKDTNADTLVIKRYLNHVPSKRSAQNFQDIVSSNKNSNNGINTINMTLNSYENNKIDKWSTSPSNTCKIKKLTFVKTVPVSNGNISNVADHNIQNYERVILNNTNFVRQSAKYTFENNKLIIEKPSDKSHNEKLLFKNEDLLDGVIFSEKPSYPNDDSTFTNSKFQMYQMDNHTDRKNCNLKQSKKTNINSNNKPNKSSINPPILEGYSTYTFKVNIKDK